MSSKARRRRGAVWAFALTVGTASPVLAAADAGTVHELVADPAGQTRPPRLVARSLPLPDLDGKLPERPVRFTLRYAVTAEGRPLGDTLSVTGPRGLVRLPRELWPPWLGPIARSWLAAPHEPGRLQGRPVAAWIELEGRIPGSRDVESLSGEARARAGGAGGPQSSEGSGEVGPP